MLAGLCRVFKAAAAPCSKAGAGSMDEAGKIVAKPGYKKVGTEYVPEEGMVARMKRNPKTTAAALVGLGGAYYMYG